ncbi:MAG: siderophore-interacting protein [Gordonia sp. (in: high G+C Gram-positive bacteria)]
MSRAGLQIHPLVVRCVQVRDVHEVTPRMRRVVLGGEQLGAFMRDGRQFPAFGAPGFDDHIKLIFAPGGDIADAIPRQLDNGIDWLPSEHRVTRDYTPHHVDADRNELHLDFVVHTEGGGHRGPAEAWASSARPGDDLWFVGPKASSIVPADTGSAVLIGDETAIPAIARFLTERPVDVPVRAVITIADVAAKHPHVPVRDGDLIEWVVAAPGDRDALLAAARTIEPGPAPVYVWAAAESRALLPIRRLIADEWSIPRSHTSITGYWHVRADEPADAVDEKTDVLAAQHVPHAAAAAPLAPVTWMAVRAALQLGIVDALGGGPCPAEELAAAVAVPVRHLDPLLDLLVDAGLLHADGATVAIAPSAEPLLVDEHAREEYDGMFADQVLALAGLADALRVGESAWQRGAGATVRECVAASAEQYAELVEEAESIVYLMPALAKLPIWEKPATIAVGGPAALVVADGLRTGGVDAELTVVEEREPLLALRDANPPSGVVLAERWPAVDVAVLAGACEHRTDAEVLALFGAVATATSLVVLVEPIAVDALSGRAAENALVQLGAVGVPPRTDADLSRLAEAAGLSVAEISPLGWGVAALTLARQ